MNTPHLQFQKNECRLRVNEILESMDEELSQMPYEIGDGGITGNALNMDEVYGVISQLREYAGRLHHIADKLMVEYRKMDHHEHMMDMEELRRESLAH